MMDGSQLYPKGFHPASISLDASGTTSAQPRTRTKVGGVKYYIIDFGQSTHFEDPNEQRLVTGMWAQDREVPELSKAVPYDPFRVDVYTLGNVYKALLRVSALIKVHLRVRSFTASCAF